MGNKAVEQTSPLQVCLNTDVLNIISTCMVGNGGMLRQLVCHDDVCMEHRGLNL